MEPNIVCFQMPFSAVLWANDLIKCHKKIKAFKNHWWIINMQWHKSIITLFTSWHWRQMKFAIACKERPLSAKLEQESWILHYFLSDRLNLQGETNSDFRTVYHPHLFWTDCTASSMTKSITIKQTVVKVWKPSFSCSIKPKALPVTRFINRPNLYNPTIQFSVNGLKTATPQVRSINIQSMGSSVLKFIITFISSLMGTV